ncbi:sodium:calcium antiporter [Massilia soli]|uniref:Sodium/calcium exchanger membrane region domain-containing protein n=1 Tax=Massilia soli TaxID=2792854 RepID=A0ABS7SV16_9BURK|nr:hypothetical protein [Massilia soli]
MTTVQALDFASYPLHVNLLVFACAAGAVWLAGTRVVDYADQLARATGIGGGMIGLVLLGGITSLPEIAVGVSAAWSGLPALAVNNLVGGIAMQKAILAATDGFIGRQALTVIAASPSLLLQCGFSIFMLVIVAMAIVAGDSPLGPVGWWAWALPLAYIVSVWVISASRATPAWQPRAVPGDAGAADSEQPEASGASGVALRSVALGIAVAGAGIFVAGFVLSATADALAEQTGLGANFVGAALLALATSLPELSTVIAAMRLRRYEMAIGDIMGTSMFNLLLIFLVDAIYSGPPVLGQAGTFSLFAVLLCILMSTIYLVGLVERNNRTIARFGIDSLLILLVYGGGMLLLFRMR